MSSQTNPPAGTRILHVVGKPGTVLSDVAAHAIAFQVAGGYKVGVAATSKTLRALTERIDSPNLVRFPMSIADHAQPWSDAATAFDLHRNYRHVDLVHAHGLAPAVVASLGMTGLPAAKRPTLVATLGRQAGESFLTSAGAGIVGRHATAILGSTDVIVERFADDVPIAERAGLLDADLARRIEPSEDAAQVREDLQLPRGTWMVASAARISDADAMTTLLESVVELNQQRPERPVALVLTGQGRGRAEIERQWALGQSAPVILAEPSRTVDVLAAADIVVGSRKMSGIDVEGLMQLGRPLVALGDEAAAREFGPKSPSAPPRDVAGLTRAISDLIDDPAARALAGVGAKERIIARTPEEEVELGLLDVYQRALQVRRSGALV